MTKHLSGAEVDAIFAGKLSGESMADAKAPDSAAPPRQPRYVRCFSCRVIQPFLLTFSGDRDWSPDIPEHGPVRDLVRQLRQQSGRRTVLLCDSCVERSSELVSPASDPQVAIQGSLFDAPAEQPA